MTESRHCKRTGCICTHTDDCEYGWIFGRQRDTQRVKQPDGTWIKVDKWYDCVVPCPTCDPEKAAIFRQARNSDELGEMLRARSISMRSKYYDEQERKQTRTL